MFTHLEKLIMFQVENSYFTCAIVSIHNKALFDCIVFDCAGKFKWAGRWIFVVGAVECLLWRTPKITPGREMHPQLVIYSEVENIYLSK